MKILKIINESLSISGEMAKRNQLSKWRQWRQAIMQISMSMANGENGQRRQ
jgi:hypothetical protein